jgi:hypothetical protein
MAVEEALLSLASLGGRTVAAAMATDAWESVKRDVARLLGRGYPSRTEMLERRLEQSREEWAGIPTDQVEEAGERLAVAWQTRLLDALEEHPEMAVELRGLIDGITVHARVPAETVSAAGHGVAGGRDVTIAASGGGVAAGTIHGNVTPANPAEAGQALPVAESGTASWVTSPGSLNADRGAVVIGRLEYHRPTASGPPVRLLRVSEADSQRLGVHAAISVPGTPDGGLPEYVLRDVDASESGVRAKVAAAARRGGFVLLVGGSSVGKSRCAVEAVRAVLPDWWLVHPAGPAEVAALAEAPAPRTVVWLDELQRYLYGGHGLTGGVVRALLNSSHPAVIIGTLWPDLYTAYIAMPEPGDADPFGREREVLNLASVVRISATFSLAEEQRASRAAIRDHRLKIALDTVGYGLTQTLAAAPQLVAFWEDAKSVNPYAWAVLTAALDAARLGARAPLGADFLRAAAVGYCTSQQQALAPENWFEQALASSTVKLHGAIAALSPTGDGMGRIGGYVAADYLIQHASRERRHAHVPASTWDAAVSHIPDPADALRLADRAMSRLLYGYAISLYRISADAGNGVAVMDLVDLLLLRGDLDGAEAALRVQADAGDWSASSRLADLLGTRGDFDGLRVRADAGDGAAGARLGEMLLIARGDITGAERVLQAAADEGNGRAQLLLAGLLAGRGDMDGLRARADAGDNSAAMRLTRLLAENGDADGLRARADAGDTHAAMQLTNLLAGREGPGGAPQIPPSPAYAHNARPAANPQADLLSDRQWLGQQADAGDTYAAWLLANLLARQGDAELLSARADAGDTYAARRLVDLLAKRGDVEGLRLAQSNTGGEFADNYAATRLVDVLVEQGSLDAAEQIVRPQIDAGDLQAGRRLVDILTKRGREEEAERVRRFGLNPDGTIACA